MYHYLDVILCQVMDVVHQFKIYGKYPHLEGMKWAHEYFENSSDEYLAEKAPEKCLVITPMDMGGPKYVFIMFYKITSKI